jgi:hypothetical protein
MSGAVLTPPDLAVEPVAIRAHWMPYKMFPYERRLGLMELESLGVRELVDREDCVAGVGAPAIAERLTYFESVAAEEGERATEQALVEREHLEMRDGPLRQPTRYGLHGIHEYKGKFNPQIVRALCNVVDPRAEALIDPFCGSGTALVEGMRLGMDAIGIDPSPIAGLIAEAKLRGTSSSHPDVLAEKLRLLGDRVAEAMEAGQSGSSAPASSELEGGAQEYLERWFTPPAHRALVSALALLRSEEDEAARQLARVAISSILRDVSLQLPEDLRIRRRPEPFVAPPMAPLFLDSLDRIRRGLLELSSWPSAAGGWTLVHGSAEEADAYAAVADRRRKMILTSPPYATALPYIDTDRLSIVALGLSGASELTSLERSLIGSREWSRPQSREWDARRRENADRLPDGTISMVERIEELNAGSDAGFRRQAVPSLLYRYFARMAAAFDRWSEVLASGEAAVLIVGHNHTNAGGERFDIPTPSLLAEIAEPRGFAVEDILKLETWPRYGLHAANGVPGEDALILRRDS